MNRIVGLWVLSLCISLSAHSQVDTSFIYNTSMPYGTLDLRIAKSPTRYYYLQEGITFSYRESAPGVKTNTYTSMTTWNTSAYGQGNLRERNGSTDRFVMNYRLLKPNNYKPDYKPGYPIIIMFHGGGEAANCWIDARCHWATAGYNPVTNSPPAPRDEFHKLLNNDRNLLHGGAQHLTAVNLAGSRLPDDPALPEKAFPGFVLFPQSLNGWGPHATVEDAIRILRLLIKKYNIDENRVYVHGLSNGGGGVYQALKRAPWLFAAALPMSAVNDGGIINQGMAAEVGKLPLWIFQGGQDNNPTPQRTYNYVRNFRKAGANVRYYFYSNLGHGTWNTAYREPDFFSWMLDKKKNNPHIFFGNPVICNTTQTGVRMGFSKGFFGYQWERDGQIIEEAREPEYATDVPGTYRGRFSRTPNPGPNDWEPWSDPIVVTEMNPQKPGVEAIGTAHLRGPGLPNQDPFNTVNLRAVESAELYVWFRNGSELNFQGTDVDDTLRTVTFTNAFTGSNGAYTLVNYNNNCPSPPSDPVNLFFSNSSPQSLSISADAINFKGTPSAASIFLSWSDVSDQETGYEIWRRKAGTPHFTFVVKTKEDAVSYHDTQLDPGSVYEYKLRAVNNSGRSNYLPSDDVNVNYKFQTRGDVQAPPPPQDLKVATNTLTTITLSWKAAADESSVKEYRIYYRGDSVSTGSNATTYTLTGLTQNSVYPVTVRALDYGNHRSQPSNQILATTYLSGLVYKHSTGAWESLDDSAMVATWRSPEFTGTVDNFTLQPRTQDDYFNFQFTGYLNIETEGTYYFNLTSSDGSRLLLDGNVIVNNDGIHGTKTVASDAVYLETGPHAIEVQYFDDVGGHTLNVRYRGPGIGDGIVFVPIPDAALRSGTFIPPAPPTAPTGVVANGTGMRKVNISWQFADDAQTDYEVYRAPTSGGPYEIVLRAKGTSAVDSIALLPGMVYYYRVKTVNQSGSSGYSNTATATTTADNIAPSVPRNLALLTRTLSNLAFSWEPSTDNVAVVRYEVYNGPLLIGTSTIHAFTVEDLQPNTAYTLTVRAVDASGNRSAASTALVVETEPTATFYSLASGNLNDLASWRQNADGTGAAPLTFSDNGQYFIVANRTSTSPGGEWHVGGASSRVVIPAGVTFTADAPMNATIELQGDAVLNLDHPSSPRLAKLSPQSTVNFNAVPIVPGNTYGNIILSGSITKTFDADSTNILGDLTVGEGLPLKGAPHNESVIRLEGKLTLHGTRPATSADNSINIFFAGILPHTVTTGSDLSFHQLTISAGQSVDIVHPSTAKVNLYVGSLNGGGLRIFTSGILQLNDHNLIVRESGVINADQEVGAISINGGDLWLASASSQHSNLYFTPEGRTINRLTIDLRGTGQAIVHSPVQITDGIQIIRGRLASNGNVILVSTAERTAVIYEIANNGAISGDVTVQQFLESNGFQYLSTPVGGVTVSMWQQSFPVKGQFTGASPGGSAPSLFRYNGSGWTPHPASGGSNTAPIARGTGYAANIDTAPLTISASGNPYQGSIAFNLFDGTSDVQSKGWTFLGNPFASPIAWTDAAEAWARSGVNNVIAVRRNQIVNGQMRSQVYYFDLLLKRGVIQAGEGFWVKTFNANPSLTIKEGAKLDRSEEAQSSESKYLAVVLKQGDIADSTFIAFTPGADDGLDPQLDGRKMRNYGMFNLSSTTADTVALAVNHLSTDYCSKTVDLAVQDVSPGSYALSFSNVQSLTDIGQVSLVDHFLGTSTTISSQDYVFSVSADPASYGTSRFQLIFARDQVDLSTPVITAADVCAPGPGYVIVSRPQEGALYQVINEAGAPISDMVAGVGESIRLEVPTETLTGSVTRVRVSVGFPGCSRSDFPNVYTLNFISELTVSTEGNVSMCEGDDVVLQASGTPNGGFYKWYDAGGNLIPGQAGQMLLVSDVFSESVFYVASALPGGCESARAEIHIFPDTLDMPVILVEADTLYTDVVGYYQWKKDGLDIPGATFHYYVPLEDGMYSVVASNGGCVKESEPYQIGQPVTGIHDPLDGEFTLDVYPVPSRGSGITISVRTAKTDPVLIEIIDALGRLYFRQTLDATALMHGVDITPSSTLNTGVYFVRATQAEMITGRKVEIRD